MMFGVLYLVFSDWKRYIIHILNIDQWDKNQDNHLI